MSYTIQERYQTPCRVLIPQISKINGVVKKDYTEGEVFFASVKAYGGTESVINNVFVIQDTLSIETYYRQDIKGDCLLELLDDNSKWEILNTPEQIDREKKTITFKVKRYNPKA